MTSFNYRSLAALGLLITLVACEKSNGAGQETDAVRKSSNEHHAEPALLLEAGVKETVQKYLKDPQSAQFKVVLISDSGKCSRLPKSVGIWRRRPDRGIAVLVCGYVYTGLVFLPAGLPAG